LVKNSSARARRAGVSSSSPAVVGNNQSLVQLGGFGWDGATYDKGGGWIEIATAQAWTSVNHGTRMMFATTPRGSSTRYERMRIDPAGNVGIGTTTPGFPLNFANTLGDKISLWGSSGSHYGFGIQSNLLQIHADISGSDVAFGYGRSGAFTERMRIKGSGNVGIGTKSPQQNLSVNKALNIDQANLNNGTFTSGVLSFGSASGEGIGSRRTVGANRYGLDFYTLFLNRMTITQGGNVGIGTTNPAQKLDVNGTARVKVLEIMGADLAEKFPTSEKVEPGMVVEIDPDHAGQLRVSQGAYNRRVAGVVSGANGLSVGAILGNLPGYEDAPPIALSGRVWVYCDASNGAIQPGDLLTTSDTPGHAMKAVDYPRAQGAIIGKVMTGLESGSTGLVLVLVSLQ
jgi:hypothetical protein